MFDDLLDDEIEELDDHESDLALGIDLGTTNSVVAAVVEGDLKVLADVRGRSLHPSVVSWLPDGERLVGAPASERRTIDPENTIFSAKRLIGQPYSSARVQEAKSRLPYRIAEGEQEEVLLSVRGGEFSVPQLSSYILLALRELAEEQLGGRVSHCVVTVPAHFSDAQRAATRRAAELAGMEVLRVLNEPTAAALAYGRDRPTHQRLAVFDLGGGTFDVTLLAVRGNLYEVIATGGDPFLGGDDFDRIISTRLSEEFLARHRIDAERDPVARARLRLAAEQIKIRLTSEPIVEGTLRGVTQGPDGKPLDLPFRLERGAFEKGIAPMVDRAIAVAESVLSQAQVLPTQIDEVILVGGTTRVPLVQRRVAECFQREPRCSLDPMEVVAMGAALQAQTLASPAAAERPILFDVTPHSLRIATVGGYTKTLIAKNSTVPAEGVHTFYTARDNQERVHIRICQGESDAFDDNVPLGELILEGIPPAPRGQAAIKVAFTIDADGILQVSAEEESTGKQTEAKLSTVGFKEER